MKVILYNVGRNLNRAFRTCFSFGVSEMIIIGKPENSSIQWELKGNIYSAKGRVNITNSDVLPDISHAVALENYYSFPLSQIDWTEVDAILIGGETKGLPKRIDPLYKATILTDKPFCLTVEAALAISLYEWDKNGTKNECVSSAAF